MRRLSVKSHAAPNFDRIAWLYRWLEYMMLGPLLERTRNHHLPRLGGCREALVLGDGDGRFTARLLAMHPRLRVLAVDLSGRMLALLRRRVGGKLSLAGQGAARSAGTRLRTTQADALGLTTGDGADLVVTHFFLDCLTEPEIERLLGALVPTLAPEALWVVSEFRIPRGVLGWVARVYVRALYLAFRVLTGLRVTRLPRYAPALEGAGFVRIVEQRALLGLLTSELWQRGGEAAREQVEDSGGPGQVIG